VERRELATFSCWTSYVVETHGLRTTLTLDVSHFHSLTDNVVLTSNMVARFYAQFNT